MSIVTHDIGPDVTELNYEGIDVVGGNFGHVIPSRKELMMGEGRRDRIGEVRTFEGGETLKDTGGILTGFDILKVKLQEILDGRSLIAMSSMEETGKGERVRRATRRGVDEGPGGGRRGAPTQTCR